MVCEPNPALSLVIGEPFNGYGTSVAFAGNCSGHASCITLFSCRVMPFATEPDVRLRVRGVPFPCPDRCCPQLVRCDPPVFTAICVYGDEAIFNGPPCTVGSETSSWTQIKRLFR
jgi:hypothetical protein